MWAEFLLVYNGKKSLPWQVEMKIYYAIIVVVNYSLRPL